MRVLSFSVGNFRCFDDSQEIALDPEMTVIVGRNNLGKTALLHALSVSRLDNSPNRYAANALPASSLILRFEVMGDDRGAAAKMANRT